MLKKLPTFLGAIVSICFTLISCSNQEAQKPTYLKIDNINLCTNYDSEGSSHDKITTAWIFANNESIGTFELPINTPAILPEGDVEFLIYPGINQNGQSSTRAIYDALNRIEITRTTPNTPNAIDTITFTPTELNTEYKDGYTVYIVEDFDSPGLNLEALAGSDTNFRRTDDPDSTVSIAIAEGCGQGFENTQEIGFLVLTDERLNAEFASLTSYVVPDGTQNLYLEVSYKTNINVNFGVIAEGTGIGDVKALTASVNPKEEWNKIYIDLVTEYRAYPDATGYKLYITARKPDDVNQGYIFLDNIKLIYIR